MEGINAIEKGNRLVISVEGSIDSSNADKAKLAFEELLSEHPNKPLTLDFEKLSYISSAGLRVLLFLKKKVDDTEVINVSNEVYEILEMTGFIEMLKVKRKLREVSIEGCPLLGEGGNGKVYRLTRDEIVKIFRPGIDLSTIEEEQQSAKEAFLLGIPCAIAFDNVTCGDSYGTIYELISAKTLSEKIAENPAKTKDFAKETAELLHSLHQIKVAEGKMGDAHHVLYSRLNRLHDDFSEEELAQIKDIYECIPKKGFFVHNDFHCKNIMDSPDGYMLIDLGDAGRGNPVLDLIHTRMCYRLIGSGIRASDPNKVSFLGITYAQMAEYWEAFLPAYFGGDKEKADRYDKMLEPFSKLMYYTVAMSHPRLPAQYHEAYANAVREEVLSHIDEIKAIDFDAD